jgi:hypothetical protein
MDIFCYCGTGLLLKLGNIYGEVAIFTRVIFSASDPVTRGLFGVCDDEYAAAD